MQIRLRVGCFHVSSVLVVTSFVVVGAGVPLGLALVVVLLSFCLLFCCAKALLFGGAGCGAAAGDGGLGEQRALPKPLVVVVVAVSALWSPTAPLPNTQEAS